MEPIILEPADLFATRGRGWISKFIRFFTRSIGESRTKVNHVGVVTKGGTLRDAVVVEALSRVRRHKLVARYTGRRASDVAVFRAIDLTDDERQEIVQTAKSYVGRKYGYLKILTHVADWVLQGAYVFRHLTRGNRYPICSWLVAHAFKSAGKYFDVEPGAASPDDIWDFIQDHPDKYETVVSLGPLSRFFSD